MLALHRHLKFPRIARTQEDLINTLDWGSFRSPRDFYSLPDPYLSWLNKLQFKITHEYLNEIRRLCRHGHEEWGDAVTKKWTSITTPLAVAEINGAFALLADCAWDPDKKYFYRREDKFLIPYAMKYRFWFTQVEIERANDYSDIGELKSTALKSPHPVSHAVPFYSAIMGYQEKFISRRDTVSKQGSFPDPEKDERPEGMVMVKKINTDSRVDTEIKRFGFSRIKGRTVAAVQSGNPVVNVIETRKAETGKILRFTKDNERALDEEYEKLNEADFNPVPDCSRGDLMHDPAVGPEFDYDMLVRDRDEIEKINFKNENDFFGGLDDLEERVSKSIDEYAEQKSEEIKEQFDPDQKHRQETDAAAAAIIAAIAVASESFPAPQKDALLESVELVRTYVKDGIKIVERQKHVVPPKDQVTPEEDELTIRDSSTDGKLSDSTAMDLHQADSSIYYPPTGRTE